ncbi:hypothetical protein DFH09DRAFT_1247240 [Mycena vulgaris]|nr:hypothetical protein DFH09DRAFT_1251369 [Mycena vulgaris]KAJ6525453.1 hypothetical protein DFH09DRAFT_1250708 [Mycena vulgaris]KAJ6567713.1 hypothetical protein DFH09DRAFT_1247240 [Mycena vulgaris]
MVALCRAKCWIIQLRDEDPHIPTTQRGVRGHIIVYPQQPSAVATTLPPSIEDIITPVCVIFVGSKPPTADWLKNKATPLIVRKERVMKALDWLKIHNHLYRDVLIDRAVLRDHDDNELLPFHIQHIIPSAGIDATTSDYVPGSSLPSDSATTLDLNDILRPPVSETAFQSVVVADVDGNAPAHILRSAALKHLKKPGSNYVEIPHDRNPVNEFNNPALFPMIYPTLFPYGMGGLEDSRRRSPLSFKRHIKHLFNLADPSIWCNAVRFYSEQA